MTSRLLIVPAAGLGTRLGAGVPKLLVPVAGLPMIDRLLALFSPYVSSALVVTHPSFDEAVRQHLVSSPLPVSTIVQEAPTGMLDAIMLACDTVRRAAPDEVWIVWCDQVAIDPGTIARLAEQTAAQPQAAVVMPTVWRRDPYIHLRRDSNGRIDDVLHRREGDAMPETGESDMGLFALPRASYVDLLPQYAESVSTGATTQERNFLPFLAWLREHGDVVTFPPIDEMEALGVNTPDDLATIEQYLTARAAREGTRS